MEDFLSGVKRDIYSALQQNGMDSETVVIFRKSDGTFDYSTSGQDGENIGKSDVVLGTLELSLSDGSIFYPA